MKNENEIEQMMEKATEASMEPKCFGMSYEEGVKAALDWVLDNSDAPLD